MKKTLVIGASENEQRYSNMAIRNLRKHNHEVVAIGLKAGIVLDVPFTNEMQDYKDINTITLYLNPKNQEDYYDYILGLNPKRIIFNPGTENTILEQKAEALGIDTIEACTLVLLSTGQY
jgi:predicted CoA-binding protein